MNLIDLHVHSTKSDGTLTPKELVLLAQKNHLTAFALTDHDTTDGVDEALFTGKELGIEVVPGIELSTTYRNHDIHILGYYPDYCEESFCVELAKFRESREKRNQKMVEKLNAFGFSLSLEEIKAEAGDAVITRAHFARVMKQHGYISSISDAFSKYIGNGCPCFVPRSRLSPMDAVHFLKKHHAIPVLAHPLLYSLSEQELETLVDLLKEHGLIGIEAIYSRNTGFDEGNMRRLARKKELLITGGSDFHGANKPDLSLGSGVGNLKIPYELLEQLKKTLDCE